MPRISINIPVFMDADNLLDCLIHLSHQQQSVIGDWEIVIADYDPDNTGSTYHTVNGFLDLCPWARKVGIRVIPVDRSGIPYARQVACDNASPDAIALCCMEADTYFEEQDGLKKVTDPVLNGEALITTCDNFTNDPVIDMAFIFGNSLEYVYPHQPSGCVIRKDILYKFGGFPVDQATEELTALATKVILSGGTTKHVRTPLIKSPRRMYANILSLFSGRADMVTNYDYAFR